MTVESAARAVDARLAILVLAAEDMYSAQGPAVLEPVVDPRIAAGWALRGYIVGTDALFRPLGTLAAGAQRVYYGLLLESATAPGTFCAVVRGTSGIIEWLEDAEFLRTPSKRAGEVEAGFFGIYESFAFRHPGGAEMPVAASIASIVGVGTLTVVGHSLGAALATYLAYDVAALIPDRVFLRVFASPHPGDSAFMQAVAAAVPGHVHYAGIADIVPKVPLGLGYAHLPNTVELAPFNLAVRIRMNVGCLHHALSYASLLDPGILDAAPEDRPFASCILNHSTQVL